jgi:MATE family multidrug resistance protein
MTTMTRDREGWSLLGGEARQILRLGTPAIFAQLAYFSMRVVDTVMAGQLGPESLAAVSLGSSLWMPLAVMGMGVLLPVSPSVAQAVGAERTADCGHYLRQGLWLSQVVALLLTFVFLRSSEILALFGVDPALIPLSSQFLLALSWGLPARMAFVVLRGFTEGTGHTRPILWISIVGTLANIGLNELLMYGKWGFPALGAVGCGYATAIVDVLMALLLGLWVTLHPGLARYTPWSRWEWPEWKPIVHFVAVGWPISISLLMEVSCFGVAGLWLGQLGPTVVSAHQIAMNLASLTFMVPLGLSIAISVRVAQFIGADERDRARRTGQTGALLCGGLMLLAALAFWLLPQVFVGWYTTDAEVLRLGCQLLVLAALFQFFDGLQVAATGALRGLKQTRSTMVINTIAYWGLGLPLGAWLGLYLKWGAPGFWLAFSVAIGFAAALLNWQFHQYFLRRPETAPPTGPADPLPS